MTKAVDIAYQRTFERIYQVIRGKSIVCSTMVDAQICAPNETVYSTESVIRETLRLLLFGLSKSAYPDFFLMLLLLLCVKKHRTLLVFALTSAIYIVRCVCSDLLFAP